MRLRFKVSKDFASTVWTLLSTQTIPAVSVMDVDYKGWVNSAVGENQTSGTDRSAVGPI